MNQPLLPAMQFRCTRLNAWLKADDCASRSAKADGGQVNVKGARSGDAAAYACCAECPIGAAHRKLEGKIMEGLHVRALPGVLARPPLPAGEPLDPGVPPPVKPQDASAPKLKRVPKTCSRCGAAFQGYYSARLCAVCKDALAKPAPKPRGVTKSEVFGDEEIKREEAESLERDLGLGQEDEPATPSPPDVEAKPESKLDPGRALALVHAIESDVRRRVPDRVIEKALARFGDLDDGRVRRGYVDFKDVVLGVLMEEAIAAKEPAEPTPAAEGAAWTEDRVQAVCELLEFAGYELDDGVRVVPRGLVILVRGAP